MIYGLLERKNHFHGQGELPKTAENISKITTGGQAAVSKQLLNRRLTSSCVAGQAWGQGHVTDPLQFPPFIDERGKIHFSKKEAWLARAGRVSAAEISTQKAGNVDAARTRSGGRTQAPLWSDAISAGI